MSIVLNNCASREPHTPHSWKGEITQYQCLGVPKQLAIGGIVTPGLLPLNIDADFILKEYAKTNGFNPFAISNEDLTEASSSAEERIAKERDAAWGKFLEGYREYGEGAADELGLAGQWGDLYRKIKKLKRPLWEGDREALTRESPRQVLQDIIGHALLALDMLERGM